MPSGNSLWFSQQWIMEDRTFANLDLSNDAQSYITSFETLAQMALLHCASAMVPSLDVFAYASSHGAIILVPRSILCAFLRKSLLYSVHVLP